MAIDYSVTFPCEPKRHFGGGDPQQGTLDILERLKSLNRAAAFRQIIQNQHLADKECAFTVQTIDAQGHSGEKQVTLAEVDAQAKPLAEHGARCQGCPASFLGQPWGCFGAINYPVAQAGEEWLLQRVQPPGTLGAQLCAEFMAEFKIDGRSISGLRRQGLFEAGEPAKTALAKGLFKSTWLTTDQLLEPIIAAGSLEPGHCFGILFWLGAIRVDGTIPTDPQDKARLTALIGLKTAGDKQAHTQLELGSESNCEAIIAFRNLVKALYLCWVFDVPLYLSA